MFLTFILNNKNVLKKIGSLLLILFFLMACKNTVPEENNQSIKTTSVRDLPEIIKDGKLTVLFENNSSSYFDYRGTNMGFEYEIIKEFCKDHQLELELKLVNNRDDIFKLLNEGNVDIIACNLSVTNDRKKEIAFSSPILFTEQVLVQRKLDKNNPEDYISDATELANKKVNVWDKSVYYTKLKNIQNEIGDTIFIYGENGDLSTEYIIEQVADGTIDYTVTDKNTAIINQYYWDNLDISLHLSFKQKIAFGLRKNAVKLNAELDNWIEKFKTGNLYKFLQYKYFELPSTARIALQSSSNSNYEQIKRQLKKKVKNKPFDWELLAAIIYTESRFNPEIIGLGGAYGLFQFMPNIGPKFNVYPTSTIDEQIEGGVKLVHRNYNLWENAASEEDRIKFTLAGYNSGAAHLRDAMALAKKHRLNPNKWKNNVEIMYRNLSSPEYYKDPVVKYGSSRGVFTVNYVRKVYNKYLEYKEH